MMKQTTTFRLPPTILFSLALLPAQLSSQADSYQLPRRTNPARPWIIEMIRISGVKHNGHRARRNQDRLIPVLINVIEKDNDEVPEWGMGALHRLYELGERAPVEQLLKWTEDQRKFIRHYALRALGSSRSAKALPILISHMETEYAPSAASGLKHFHAEEAIQVLTNALLNSKDRFVQRECIVSLAEIASQTAMPALKEFRLRQTNFTDDWTTSMRSLCENAIAKIEMATSSNREIVLLHELKRRLREDPSDVDFVPGWELRQIAALRLTSLLPDLRQLLGQRKRQIVLERRHDGKNKNGRFDIDQDEWCFQLALTIHKLGGKLTEDEKRTLAAEGLL